MNLDISNLVGVTDIQNHVAMKISITSLAFAAAISALLGTTPEARSADLALRGYGSYDLGTSEAYFSKGPRQGGRYRNLGADYYRSAEIEIDAVRNFSRSRSGSMSFELWVMPFYGADSGLVIMTNALKPLNGRRAFNGVYASGSALSLDEPGFAELSLWEYTRRGWAFRDALSFTEEDWF